MHDALAPSRAYVTHQLISQQLRDAFALSRSHVKHPYVETLRYDGFVLAWFTPASSTPYLDDAPFRVSMVGQANKCGGVSERAAVRSHAILNGPVVSDLNLRAVYYFSAPCSITDPTASCTIGPNGERLRPTCDCKSRALRNGRTVSLRTCARYQAASLPLISLTVYSQHAAKAQTPTRRIDATEGRSQSTDGAGERCPGDIQQGRDARTRSRA